MRSLNLSRGNSNRESLKAKASDTGSRKPEIIVYRHHILPSELTHRGDLVWGRIDGYRNGLCALTDEESAHAVLH